MRAAAVGSENQVPLEVRHVVEWNGRERLEEHTAAFRAHFVLETPTHNDGIAGSEPAGLALDRDGGVSFKDDHYLLAGVVRVTGNACSGLVGDTAEKYLIASDRLQRDPRKEGVRLYLVPAPERVRAVAHGASYGVVR